MHALRYNSCLKTAVTEIQIFLRKLFRVNQLYIYSIWHPNQCEKREKKKEKVHNFTYYVLYSLRYMGLFLKFSFARAVSLKFESFNIKGSQLHKVCLLYPRKIVNLRKFKFKIFIHITWKFVEIMTPKFIQWQKKMYRKN